MDILPKIIAQMSKEEIRFFRLYMERLNYDFDRKDLLLFESYRLQGDKIEEEALAQKLYGKADKNSFYRLKNRLLAQLNKSLVLQHQEDDSQMRLKYLLMVYQYHLMKKNTKVASYFLLKAEKLAEEIENYQILDLVYHEQIKISTEFTTINPQKVNEKRELNFQRSQNIREIEQVLAQISYELKVSQNYSSGDESLYQYLEKTIKKSNRNNFLQTSKMFRTQLFNAVSQVLLQKHDYVSLENFVKETIKIFIQKKWFDKSNHEVCLKMHTYRVNSLFKNGKYNQSLKAAEELKVQMEKYNGVLADKYTIFYYNAIVINYSVVNPKEALIVLENLKSKHANHDDSFYHNFIFINLAIVYFRQNNYENAIDQIIELGTKESFKKAAPMLQLKLSVLEMMIRLEMNDSQIIEYRISQVLRQFKSLFTSEEGMRQKTLLSIILKMAKMFDAKSRKKVLELLENFLSIKSAEVPDDADLIDYFRWARHKIDKWDTKE
jgi:hypothetical protein